MVRGCHSKICGVNINDGQGDEEFRTLKFGRLL